MTTRNDITGDSLTTKTSTDNYRDGWDRIFGNKEDKESLNNSETKEETSEDSEDNERRN